MKTEELLLDRYKIISKLGRGGFADVYKAFDTRMERVVAIKQIHVNRHSAERVLREARTVALLNHPNIVTIHEFEEDGDDCYLIMELIEGVPLSKILSRISPLSVHEALIITIEICRALEAAHLNGIIHRDIKPENIMILYDGRKS
ncbi:MAG: serine/threonine-protein kinase, partial [Candidatus Aquicultor sp.]